MNKVMQAAHQYAIRFPGFARGEITAAEIDAAKLELEAAVKEAIDLEREACAMACEEIGTHPSSLWEEAGCWKHSAQNCADAIRMRSNAKLDANKGEKE